jgi:FAD dependent oxidoreductase
MQGRDFVVEAERRTPLWGEYDLVVLGGGPSGIAAASCASRLGLKTLLIEHYGFLGGMGTAAGVTNFCGLHALMNGRIERVVHGFATELLAQIESLGGLNDPHLLFGGRIAAQAYDNAAYKIAADRITQRFGVELLFHTRAVGVQMHSKGRIKNVLIENKSGRFAVSSKLFIDASGDADLSYHAGVPFEKGTHATDMMYPTSMFRLNGVNASEAHQSLLGIDQLMEEARQEGAHFARRTPIIKPQKNNAEWRANVTQLANPDGSPVDGCDAMQLSLAEVQGREQIAQFMQFLKDKVPGFEGSYLLEIAPQVGIRETRRIVGDYVLSEEDVLTAKRFEDSMGVNAWMVEEHIQGDVRFKWPHPGASHPYNQLPYRMICPKDMDNLWVVGRCASMTHGGQSAARVSGACLVMGQAAGVAAALALQSNQTPKTVSIQALQHQLQVEGVFLG